MPPRLLLAVFALLPAAIPAAEPAPFSFAAFGCMPYARHAGSDEGFRRLLAEVDRHQPAFAVHLGDTLGGDEPATDAFYLRRRDDFNRLATALVYTPGDNEWTDTHRPGAGGFDPLERLARLREVYFAEERSLAISNRRSTACVGWAAARPWSASSYASKSPSCGSSRCTSLRMSSLR